MTASEKKSFANAKVKLDKQNALAHKKKLAKEAKKMANSSTKPTLSALMAHRDGGELHLTQNDHNAELTTAT